MMDGSGILDDRGEDGRTHLVVLDVLNVPIVGGLVCHYSGVGRLAVILIDVNLSRPIHELQ